MRQAAETRKTNLAFRRRTQTAETFAATVVKGTIGDAQYGI
jgi:hypothetical protein